MEVVGRQVNGEIGLHIRKAAYDNDTEKQPKPKNQAKLEPFMYKPITRNSVTDKEEEEQHGSGGAVVIAIVVFVILVSVVVLAEVWRRKGDFFRAKDDRMKMVQLQRENS